MALTDNDLKKIEQVADKVATKHTEELAVIVAKGFAGMKEYVDERFTKTDGKFETMAKRFDKIDGTLEDHTDRLGRIEQRLQTDTVRLDNHDQRISTLEKTV